MTKVATPKKTVVKKVAKKTVSKKTTAVTKPVLVYAEDALSFWVADGQILNSLMALSDAVGKMDKKTFVHHV